MLFLDKKTYCSSVMLTTSDFHADFVKFNKKYCKPYEFVRIISAFNKGIKKKMMNTGEFIELPYIGRFGFLYVTPEDDYKIFGTPRTDDSKKAAYWLSQDDEHFHEIDNTQFYTDQARLAPLWFKPKDWVRMKRHCAKCFVLKISRDIHRNAITKFRSEELYYHQYTTR